MGLTIEQKLKVVGDALRVLADHYTIVPMRQHAAEAAKKSAVPLVEPNFKNDRVAA
jgi:hypothetical protein